MEMVAHVPIIQEEKQNLKEIIESEYGLRFRLLTEENELSLLRLQDCKFDLNARKAKQNQLIKFSTELEKSQETLQQAEKQACEDIVKLGSKQRHQMLSSDKKVHLWRLDCLTQENMTKLKESEAHVSEHLYSLQRIIIELEKTCKEPDSSLLQNARYNLERSESLLLQCLKSAVITDLSSCQIKGMSKMLAAFQRHVTLDPETAHPCLALSGNLKSVRFSNTGQDMPGSPWRCDFSATVCGAESFATGKHYWEVDVARARRWQLGICSAPDRKGNKMDASGNKVLLMSSVMGTDYTLWVFPPLKKIYMGKPIDKVGVFLDYEYGQLSFYNVTDSSLIYSFSNLTCQGNIKPIFSLCISNGRLNSDSLTVSP
ncbi:putative E3 ubiquitin-protein ligase TRIML2 [Thomomys bottae]